ncbi:hypothetical protein B7Y94_01660 [Candidatus Saccharibacteria bacterium 32-49-12]|nr:MAG: hypothetical protein B7Y94_01660 [Candidatus Saccharibacteria bacterium 32-49-12]
MYVTKPRSSKIDLPRLKAWLAKHRLAAILIAGSLVVFIVFQALILGSVPSVDYNAEYNIKPRPQKVYSPLTGVQLPDGETVNKPVTAVMIENSPDARPQSGLKDAGIVYEAVAEGGITRFIALYQHTQPELIGPVRSLRIYYLDWAAPYQASIAHVGGSGNALAEVRNGNYRDIDQFFNAGSYWRATDRYAPHNMYTNFERLNELNRAKGYTSSEFKGFERVDGEPAEQPSATSIAVNFSSDLYNTTYTYDAASNTYARSLGGAEHHDREKGRITPSSVVVIQVNAQSRGGTDPYEDLITSGSGQAHVFQNGTWVGAITSGRGNVSWQ